MILWKIHEGVRTPAALRRAIPIITKKMLYEGLYQLGDAGLIVKDEEQGYVVTPLGASLRPMLEQAWAWGKLHASGDWKLPVTS